MEDRTAFATARADGFFKDKNHSPRLAIEFLENIPAGFSGIGVNFKDLGFHGG